MEETYARDWKYFATEETVTYRKLTAKGLGLPKPVLRKIYYEKAVKWAPGLVPTRPTGTRKQPSSLQQAQAPS
jgi:hypothetical protein